MREIDFRTWLQETEAPVTGPVDWMMRKMGKTAAPVVQPLAQAGATVGNAALQGAGALGNAALSPLRPNTPIGVQHAYKQGANVDWDALAQGGIPSRMDPEDEKNFGFTTERNLMDYINKAKAQGKTLAEKFRDMLGMLIKETKTIGYQTVGQAPDLVVVKPAQKLSLALAKLCKVVKEKGEPAEQSQDPEAMKAALQEAQAALEEVHSSGKEFKEALKMIGYGTIMGHWIMALGTYLYFTGQLMAFEHWLNDHTFGLGVALLVGYKAMVNIIFLFLPMMKAAAKSSPDSIGGKFSAAVVGAIDNVTPSALKHEEEPEQPAPPRNDFDAKAQRYGEFQKQFAAWRQRKQQARQAGKIFDEPAPEFNEAYNARAQWKWRRGGSNPYL